MSTISLRLPESLHRRVRELAREEAVSIHHFIASAVAEKMAALDAGVYLEARGRSGTRRKFLRALAKVKGATPIPEDRP
ncbi:MAG: toxin-antitoxin system HicB family antitoxin [Planctomycetes bacterium]|nr:toxin-antitoxin system HicB family antitoxin [Planctomycetota bacterium]